jgi:hypothetical protein
LDHFQSIASLQRARWRAALPDLQRAPERALLPQQVPVRQQQQVQQQPVQQQQVQQQQVQQQQVQQQQEQQQPVQQQPVQPQTSPLALQCLPQALLAPRSPPLGWAPETLQWQLVLPPCPH